MGSDCSRALLIEPDEDLRQLLARVLRRSILNVFEAPSCAAASKILLDQSVCLLVCDFEGNQPEYLDEVQQFTKSQSFSGVVLLGDAYPSDALEELLQRPGCCFLPKPFSTIELTRAVQTALCVSLPHDSGLDRVPNQLRR